VDSNFKSGKLYEFNLGLGQVIAGWDRGLTKMCVGEKRVLTIPASRTNRECLFVSSFGWVWIRFVRSSALYVFGSFFFRFSFGPILHSPPTSTPPIRPRPCIALPAPGL
jgi:hypothetical protein